jgi:choline kinase
VKELLDEARLWRPANSAQWVAWGVVQAKVPELAGNKGNDADSDDAKEEEDEFDYLSYAQDRSYFFWGDCVQMGLVKLEELPESLQSRLKIVKY